MSTNTSPPPFISVSVHPQSLSLDSDAQVVAAGCQEILTKFELTDIEVILQEVTMWGSHAQL